MDKEAWKDRWTRKKKPAPTVEPLPHGGYVIGEDLAARNTAAVRAQYGVKLDEKQTVIKI